MLAKTNEEYEQVFNPDKAKLQELIRKAKGSSRTMAQYAEQCGVSASTLSRISNGRIISAIDEDLILKLNKYQDSEVQYTLEDWLNANGMRKKADREFIENRQYGTNFMNQGRSRKAKMERCITNKLTDIGVTIRKMSVRSPKWFNDMSIGLKTMPDLRLFLPDKKKYWNYYIFANNLDDVNASNKYNVDAQRLSQQFVYVSAPILLIDAWKPQLLEDEKVSFVFSDEKIMGAFIKCLTGSNIKNEFSIVLMDPNGEEIIKETDLQGGELSNSIYYLDYFENEEEQEKRIIDETQYTIYDFIDEYCSLNEQ